MASKASPSYIRSLQRQSRAIYQRPSRVSRAFATTSTRNVEPLPPSALPSSSIPPITPARAQAEAKVISPSTLRKVTGTVTETYTAYGATELLYKNCARQADYKIEQAKNAEDEVPKTEDGEDLGVGEGWWLTEAGLKPTFSTWSQVTMLHMYLLSVRLRCFPAPSAQPWQQHLLDHFFYDAENRMTIDHNMHARGTRNKYLKDLFVQWRGLLAAYDEGLVKGDAVLAAAVWRNIFKANENVDINVLAQIVSYMRKALKGLDALPDEKIGQATLQFGNPEGERSSVSRRSRMMEMPFEKAEGTDLAGVKQS